MKFINCLQVILSENNDEIQEKIILLEEELTKNELLEMEITEKEILLFNKNFFDNEKIWFIDYVSEWKILKQFLLDNSLATEQNYKTFFKIKKVDFLDTTWDINKQLDSMIAKVEPNDKKLLEIDTFLKNLKK